MIREPTIEPPGAPVEANPDARSVGAAVERDRLALVYAQGPTALLAGPVLAGVLAAAVGGDTAAARLAGWVGAVVAVAVGRAALLRGWCSDDARDVATWRARYVIGAGLAGAVWGLAPLVLAPATLAGDALIGFAIGGVCAGAAPLLAPVRRAYLAFLLPAVAPLAIHLALQADRPHLAMAAMTLAFAVVMLATARQIDARIGEALSLRHENVDLLAGLTRAKEEAESANRGLREQGDQRRRAEEERERERQRLRLHFEQASFAIVEWSIEGRVVDWNPAAERMFGWSRAEALGKRAWELMTPLAEKPRLDVLWRESLERRRPGRWTIDERSKDGRVLRCEWATTPLIDGSGRLLGVASIAQDVTERETLERLKSEFVAGVSHELRTPITAIRGALGLLEGGAVGALDGEARELVAVALQNVDRVGRLIDDVLDLDRLQAGALALDLQPVSLREVTEQARLRIEGAAEAKRIRIAIAPLAPELTVRTDRTRLVQVVVELLANAVKFSPEGSTVGVDAIAGARARLEVRDQGPGISAAFRPRVFGRFNQEDGSNRRRSGGTGLGLSFAKALVERMGGEIGFVSPPEGGTVFFLELPNAP